MFRREDENHRVVIEWIETTWSSLPPGIITTDGFLVCLLSSTMVVLSKNVESLQVCQCLVQWYGITPDGRWYDCRAAFGKQYVGSLFGGRGDRGQRME